MILAENAFAEIVAWELPHPISGSVHRYKYRLALVVHGSCLLRYDNEAGKGDHRHVGLHEEPYIFSTIEQLVADFFDNVMRWRDENSNA
ncbi:MAG: toxin-antitoxin system TumE family protein [Gammaproteobacteria bacterium]